MEAHLQDLRVEVHDDALAEAVRRDYRAAPVDSATRAALAYAEKLTLRPAEVGVEDVAALRRHGWSDRDVHDLAQAAAYFNYINRIADGLGVDLEPDMPPRAG